MQLRPRVSRQRDEKQSRNEGDAADDEERGIDYSGRDMTGLCLRLEQVDH